MKKKVLVRCPCFSVSGYGIHARTVLRALRRYEEFFDIYLLPINWGATSWQSLDTEEHRWLEGLVQKTNALKQHNGQCDVSVQITIPNEYEKLAPINVGVTAGVESSIIAPIWIEKCNLVCDKILTISNHAKAGFDHSVFQAQNKETGQVVDNFRCLKPVEVVHYPALPIEVTPEDTEKFSFETDFNFLYVAQWGPRKNVEQTILEFVNEFKDDSNVGFILKLTQKNNSVMDRLETEEKLKRLLQSSPQRKCKVYLLHGFLTEKEMAALYKHPKVKALVNLAHGEGFGLPLFEAAYYGLPVIAPEWGGPLDFLQMDKKDKETKETYRKSMFSTVSYEIRPIQKEAVWNDVLIPEGRWAFPEPGSYKMRLREMYREYSRLKSQAKQLAKHILETFTEEKCYKQYAEAILGESIVEVKKEDLPKVSIVTSVFRGGEFIEEYFKDITRQTIFSQIELVLVHPKDSPSFGIEEEVIKKYMALYPNIVYKQLEKDFGIYNAWNEGFKAATGEYVANANLDDRKKVDQLEKCAKELYCNSEVDGVYFDFWISQKENETFEVNSSNGKRYSFPQYSFDTLKLMNLLHSCPMWRKSLFDKFGYFDEQYRSVSDWKFFLTCGAGGAKFKKMEEILGLYLFNKTGISTDPANNVWKRKDEKEVFLQFKDVKVEERK